MYFSGTLSRDGHALEAVIGEIGPETEEINDAFALRHGPKPRWRGTAGYRGSMETQDWTPGADVCGSTVRLVAAQGFAMDVLVIRLAGDPWASARVPFTLDFRSDGDPAVMPGARTAVPSAS